MHKQRIKPKFEILSGKKYKWMFIDKCTIGKDGYISYRNVKTRALFKLARSGWSKEESRDKFTNFKAAYNSRESYNNDESFLKLYYYYSSSKSSTTLLGALVEDQTDGCYPLMIKFDESKREIAFKKALEDIHNKFDLIWIAISYKKQKRWSRKLELQLDTLYDCS